MYETLVHHLRIIEGDKRKKRGKKYIECIDSFYSIAKKAKEKKRR